MYFRLKCEHCQKPLKIREELAGRKCKCPYCKGVVHVPMPSGIDLASMNLDAFDEPSAGPQQPAVTGPAFPQSTSPLSPAKPGADPLAPAAATPKPGAAKPAAKKPGATTATPTAKPAPAPAGEGKWTDSSNVNVLACGLIGAAASIMFLALLLPFRSFYFGELFLDRGQVPYVLVFMFFWSMAILVLKAKKIARQKTSMLLDVVPTDVSKEITRDTLDKYVEHVHGLPGEPGESFLINRVLRGLEHFRVRKNASEAADMLSSQSEIDANNVGSSYTLVKVFIWAIPIMGFIGTVLGISDSVGGFAKGISEAGLEEMKESLKSVTGGLGLAFDTTLIALVMSIIIKFPTSSLQRSEEALLNWVDEYCNENLLRRLNDGRDDSAAPGDTGSMRAAVEKALAAHRKELDAWTDRLKSIGGTISAQVADGWQDVNGKLKGLQEEWAKQLHTQQEDRAKHLRQDQDERAAKLQQEHEEWLAQCRQKQDDDSSHFQQRMEEMAQIAAGIQQTLSQLTGQAETIQQQAMESVNGSTNRLETHFEGLERGLGSLSSVLERLGEQQVVVQQVEPERKGFFRRRRNGK